jgi:hypothetical protein
MEIRLKDLEADFDNKEFGEEGDEEIDEEGK